MAKKRNDIEVEDVTGTSQYDGLQVLKDAHSLPGHYIRTRESLTLVKSYFDSFTVQYEANNPVEVCYFAGTKAHLTTIGIVGDVNSSLASTYFIITSGRKEVRYAVYFKVNGVGTAPSVAGTTNVEVNINENDPAAVVALAVELALANLGNVFKIIRENAVLSVTTVKLGVTNNTLDVGTGFTISNTVGESEQVEKVYLTYSSDGNPIFQGEELVDYKYNIYTGRFELNSVKTIVQKDYDEFDVTYDANDNIEMVEYYLGGNLVRTVNLTYNANGCLINYQES